MRGQRAREVSEKDRELLAKFASGSGLSSQRRNPVHEAHIYKSMVDRGLTHQQIANLLGRSRTEVTTVLRVLTMPKAVQGALESGKIVLGAARALMALHDDAEILLGLGAIVNDNLTIEESWKLVRRMDGVKQYKPRAHDRWRSANGVEEIAGKLLGAPVRVRCAPRGGGRLVVELESEEHLLKVMERMYEGGKDGKNEGKPA